MASVGMIKNSWVDDYASVSCQTPRSGSDAGSSPDPLFDFDILLSHEEVGVISALLLSSCWLMGHRQHLMCVRLQ